MANLIIPIPDEYVEEARIHILLAKPKPLNFEGTDLDWFIYLIKKEVLGWYGEGKKIAANADIVRQPILGTEE